MIAFKGIVHPKINSVILFSPLCCPKPVWIRVSFFWWTNTKRWYEEHW